MQPSNQLLSTTVLGRFSERSCCRCVMWFASSAPTRGPAGRATLIRGDNALAPCIAPMDSFNAARNSACIMGSSMNVGGLGGLGGGLGVVLAAVVLARSGGGGAATSCVAATRAAAAALLCRRVHNSSAHSSRREQAAPGAITRQCTRAVVKRRYVRYSWSQSDCENRAAIAFHHRYSRQAPAAST